jgi:KDO2-lipid IV(A) lauroyltransferase
VKQDASVEPALTRRGYPVERRFRKLLKRHLAYWIGLFVTGILREVPLRFCSWALSRTFLIWYVFFVKYRRRALKNMEQVFADTRDSSWYTRTIRTMFMNLGRNLAEFLHIPRFSKRRFTELVDGVEFREAITGALASGKGALCVTGHIGNWELLAAYCAKFFPTAVIAKRIYFEKFDREVVRRRQRLGLGVVYQEEGLRPVVAALRTNRVVGILADQDMPDVAGVFVDFLGREAYTPVAPAALVLGSGTPLFVVCVERLGGCRHRIHISGPVESPRTGDRENDRLELTRRWNRVLCDFIREHPAQWAWFHRRWRTTPEKLKRSNVGNGQKPPEGSSP